jgi:hypothetical protein
MKDYIRNKYKDEKGDQLKIKNTKGEISSFMLKLKATLAYFSL